MDSIIDSILSITPQEFVTSADSTVLSLRVTLKTFFKPHAQNETYCASSSIKDFNIDAPLENLRFMRITKRQGMLNMNQMHYLKQLNPRLLLFHLSFILQTPLTNPTQMTHVAT